MTPEQIESKIAEAYLRLSTASTPEARRVAFKSLRYWKEQRAPEVVDAIERERNIYTEPKP